jgi:hypothetical protein
MVFFPHPVRPLEIAAAAAQLERLIRNEIADDGRPLTLVGFGVGGLALRFYCQSFDTRRIGRVVTIGCSYRGSELPKYGTLAALAPNGSLLRDLNLDDRLPQALDLITIHSSFDATIVPPRHAIYPNAFNIQLHGIGHYRLLFSRQVFRLLSENLDAPYSSSSVAGDRPLPSV